MKSTSWTVWFLVMAALALAWPVWAGEAAAGASEVQPAISPWAALIPVAVPLLISVAKVFAPSIPKPLLPILAPILGCVATIALHYSGVTINPLLGAALGSAGVGIREIGDQLGKIGASK